MLVLECCLKLYIDAFSLGLGCLNVSPGRSDSEESICDVGDLDSIPGLRRSRGEGNDYQDSGLENSMGSPWGCKELDMTEQISLSLPM